MKKVLLVFGTRPEAVKMCPLVRELKTRSRFQVLVCVSGQHREMLDQVLECFKIVPDYDLEVMKENQNLFDVTENVLGAVRGVLEKERPNVVLVHGDTTTTFSAALAAYYLGIPVGHVEAGLRTNDIYSPFPEELNRQAAGIIARYHFAPTAEARRNLIAEGKDPSTIFVTGNTAIDALKNTVRDDYWNNNLSWAKGSRLLILTAHRRENLGQPLESIFSGVRKVAEEFPDVKFIYPVHLNPAIRKAAESVLGDTPRVRLIEPLDVVDFHNFLAHAFLVLTDSGGIQEEAPAFDVPVLVLREVTERPEGVEAGTLRLVGTNAEDIYRECRLLLTDKEAYKRMSRAKNPFGDGHASKKIADILEREL